MAADKTIWQCPVYELSSQLDGSQRLVIQASSNALQDYGVPLNLLAQWLFGNYQIGVFGGSAAPDNASGNNGDLYFRSNGGVYSKSAGVWTLKTTIPTAPIPVPFAFASGSSPSQFIAVPAGFTRYSRVSYYYKDGSNWQEDGAFSPLAVMSGSTFTGWQVSLSNVGEGGGISSDGEVVVG